MCTGTPEGAVNKTEVNLLCRGSEGVMNRIGVNLLCRGGSK
jgi:hypothetical protein